MKKTIQPPVYRCLQVFSLDPDADVRMESASLSRATLQVPWEDELQAGPVGEYVEVIDFDPSSLRVYDAVDLNEPALLAQDGYAPSIGNPQFHQQMVYAVAMKTIHNFEQALGRSVLWSERHKDEYGNLVRSDEHATLDDDPRYVQRLRIYPHALREDNAYYSPTKKALLFGYFNATTADPRQELPGGVVFTCLSHDIIAHETTHAILDGMHRRLLEPTNGDMLAFHEAFADIVAIFQHFSLPGMLLDQIQRTRGDLRTNNLLAQLACQFARATGTGDALRNALGMVASDGRQTPPDPTTIQTEWEPHQRGAILVAAVFDAFLKIYEDRIADLRRIATGGTGVLPQGDIHPDLAGRFADEAIKVADRVLRICIRAIDYIPPVDVNFGDYLRGLITADTVAYPSDPKRYRLAFIEAFRDRGIVPYDVRALGEDSLRWAKVDDAGMQLFQRILPPQVVMQTMATRYSTEFHGNLNESAPQTTTESHSLADMAQNFVNAYWGQKPNAAKATDERPNPRYRRYRSERKFAAFLHHWIEESVRQAEQTEEFIAEVSWHLGLDIERMLDKSARLEVHSVRPTYRPCEDGRTILELLVILTQTVMIQGDDSPQKFRGGCTLLIDTTTGQVQYAISKSAKGGFHGFRKKRVLNYWRSANAALNGQNVKAGAELFAGLHRHVSDSEGY